MSENIVITKSDIIWSYVAKFFSLATNIIVLPFVLHLLSAEEVGMNYLMLTISGIVMLIDFGFGPQFGRNFTYVNSGANELLKEGVQQNATGEINYHLLAVLLKTARKVYQIMSLIAFVFMLTFGTVYIYYVTDGFNNVENSLWIWIIFSVSTFFNIYYAYYTTLLIGSGMMAESAKAMMLSRIVYLGLSIILLYTGCGLFSIVIANLIAPFAQRIYCYKVYFTDELRKKTDIFITKTELKNTFNTIWYNAKKLGINNLGAYAINKFGMFLVGLYLALDIVGSYGLLIQLTTVITGVASIMLTTYMPKFSSYRVTGRINELKKLFSFTVTIFWFIIIVGGIIIVLLGGPLLNLIGSQTVLPEKSLCAVYVLICALEANHSNFATLITTKNEVPFVAAGLLSGGLIALLTFLELQFTTWGLWGVVAVQGLVQLAYNNWYWPRWVMKDLSMSFGQMIKEGLTLFNKKLFNSFKI